MKAYFTKHGQQRAQERLRRMSDEQILEQLEKGISVYLGKSSDGTRIFYLFFSVMDSQWFIAVIRKINHAIITILRHDFVHDRRINIEKLLRAREYALDPSKVPGEYSRTGVEDDTVDTVDTDYFFTALVQREDGTVRVHALAHIHKDQWVHPYSPADNSKTYAKLKAKLLKSLKPGETYISVSIRLGKQGKTTVLPYF